jgi:hypothetical protein
MGRIHRYQSANELSPFVATAVRAEKSIPILRLVNIADVISGLIAARVGGAALKLPRRGDIICPAGTDTSVLRPQARFREKMSRASRNLNQLQA